MVGWFSGLMDGSMGGLMGGTRSNQINLDLIEIIVFCLKIYDLLTHPHLCVGGWVGQWVNGMCQVK